MNPAELAHTLRQYKRLGYDVVHRQVWPDRITVQLRSRYHGESFTLEFETR